MCGGMRGEGSFLASLSHAVYGVVRNALAVAGVLTPLDQEGRERPAKQLVAAPRPKGRG